MLEKPHRQHMRQHQQHSSSLWCDGIVPSAGVGSRAASWKVLVA